VSITDPAPAPKVVSKKPRRDEVSPVPHPLGYAAPGADLGDDHIPGIDTDIEIAGIQFLSAASDDHPYQRRLRTPAKEQVDNSENPGDQSLSDWWLRTQTDWSGGAGQEFMEPIGTEGVDRRYWASAGVDPFTRPGQVWLLPASVALDPPLAGPAGVARFAGGIAVAGGTTVRVYNEATPPAQQGTQTASAPVRKVTVAGGFVMLSMDGKIATMPVSGASAPVDRYTGAPDVPICAYVKNRTLVMSADKVWEVPGNPDVPLDMATAAPNVNLHDPTWTWVGAANTPTAILIAGNGAGTGSILSLTIDPQSGNLPTLAAPTIVAELPPNEQITGIATYLGAYVVLATTAGIRVGSLGQNGGLTYGPLLGSPPMAPGGDFTLWDRFAQYPTADAGDGRGGLVRIDLSGLDKDSRAPWSTFLRIPASVAVVDHVMLGSLSAVMLDSAGQAWSTAPGASFDVGWLETSRVRYGTLEPKNFSSVKVMTAAPVSGELSVHTLFDGVTGPRIGVLNRATGPEDLFSTGNRKALSQMALRFEWTPDALTLNTGPVLEAWSMRSLPSITENGEVITLSLLCFDFERTHRGINAGYEGRAYARWKALAARIMQGGDIQVKEINSGATYQATPVDCLFTQVAAGNRASGFGGIIDLQVREVQ
jgi:hypothetical protein